MDNALKQTENRMKKSVELLVKDYSTMRAGRATPSLLENVLVDYYGTPTPVNQMATVTVPEPRLLAIQPWDKNMMPQIEKAILKSDLGINPISDGNVIRLTVPTLTEEKRKDLVKVVHKKAEEGRIAIRNLRREINDQIKGVEKKGDISEDMAKRYLNDTQELTDKYTKKIDEVAAAKEKEIMEI
ncbi:MAG: ribosome recycling factor [Syntrophaceticus sp.]|nr:ribosome recycling factor [Syntrophaceticus sp.]MDD3313893.1 ribosome recycling factor [Syntrophaceticus sp.]MDD4358971.1 ribosome recycling factor [Syntrophaceticus sp.]MDD4782531.1 ribosome recycling factor [Syntrophaceticus sp.]